MAARFLCFLRKGTMAATPKNRSGRGTNRNCHRRVILSFVRSSRPLDRRYDVKCRKERASERAGEQTGSERPNRRVKGSEAASQGDAFGHLAAVNRKRADLLGRCETGESHIADLES